MTSLAFAIEYLNGEDIAKLLITRQSLDDNVELLIKKNILERHGKTVAIEALKYSLAHQLSILDNFPVRSYNRFKKRGTANVIRGNQFDSIRRVVFNIICITSFFAKKISNNINNSSVGGCDFYETQSQYPPQKFDSWSIEVNLKKGLYDVKISGWRNIAHGVLDLWIGNQRITDAHGIDYNSRCTIRCVDTIENTIIPFTGCHKLIGQTNRSSNGRYWMCLDKITFKRRR